MGAPGPNHNAAGETDRTAGSLNEEQESLDLEGTEAYIRRTRVEITKSKARTAHLVATVLAFGVVFSLPLYVIAVAYGTPSEMSNIDRVFDKWFDVVGPLLGTAIGALFGLAIAGGARPEAGA